MQGPGQLPPSLLASQYASAKATSKAEGAIAYLDVTSAQALLSTAQRLPAHRGQSAGAGSHDWHSSSLSAGAQQRRAQTASSSYSPVHGSLSRSATASRGRSSGGGQSAQPGAEQADSSGSLAASCRRPR
jgi:hypothetical protein